MYRVLMIVRNKNDEEITINYGTHDNKFEAIHALTSAMSMSDERFYRIEEYRIEVV